MNALEQAIISSPRYAGRGRCEVLATSSGMDEQLSHEITRWLPGGDELINPSRSSVSFFHAESNTFVLARTVIGGGNNVDGQPGLISKVVAFKGEQLKGYNFNVGLLLHALLSAGQMHIPQHCFSRGVKQPDLSPINLDNRLLTPLPQVALACLPSDTVRILEAIEIHRRIAIFGPRNPIGFLSRFLNQLPLENRLSFSFCSEQKLRNDRSFTIQFFEGVESELLEHATSQQVRTITIAQNPTALVASI